MCSCRSSARPHDQIMRISGVLLALAVATGGMAGCAGAGRGTRLEPLEFQQRSVQSGHTVKLESGGYDVGVAEVSTGGAFRTVLGRQRMQVLHVRLTVRNNDVDPLKIPIEQLAIEGVGRDRLRPLTVFGQRDGESIVV